MFTVHQQITDKLKGMFNTHLQEEEWKGVDIETADTATFLRLDGDFTIFGFTQGDMVYEIMLSEENIDGLLTNDKESLDLASGCIYQALCDMEEDYLKYVDDDEEFSEEFGVSYEGDDYF